MKLCLACNAQFDDSVADCVHCGGQLRETSAEVADGDGGLQSVLLTQREAIFAGPLLEALADAGIAFQTLADDRTGDVDSYRGGSGQVGVYVSAEVLDRARAVETQQLAETLPDLPEGYDPTIIHDGACPACGHPLGAEDAECGDCGLVILEVDA